MQKKSGVDYVKFQIFKPQNLAIRKKISKLSKKKTLNQKSSQLLNKYKLSFQILDILYKYAKTKKIKFLATAFDEESLKFLNTLKVDFIKVSSGEINNLPFFKLIKKNKKKKGFIINWGVNYKRSC